MFLANLRTQNSNINGYITLNYLTLFSDEYRISPAYLVKPKGLVETEGGSFMHCLVNEESLLLSWTIFMFNREGFFYAPL